MGTDYKTVAGRVVNLRIPVMKDPWCFFVTIEEAGEPIIARIYQVMNREGHSEYSVDSRKCSFRELLHLLIESRYDVELEVPNQPSYLDCHIARFTTVREES